jgi:hypothetical protein
MEQLAARFDAYADLVASEKTPADLWVALRRVIENSENPDTIFDEAVRRADVADYGQPVFDSRHVAWVAYFSGAPGRLRGALSIIALIADTQDRGADLDDLVRMAGLRRKLARQHVAELCEAGHARWDVDGLHVVCPVTRGTY